MGLIKMYARKIKYLVNGPGTTTYADGYVASPVRYSTIDVQDLADHISADSRIERSKVAVITDSLIKQIKEMVLNGHKIEVPHLGTFKPKIKSALAPTEEMIDSAAFSAKVRFTPSVELKRDLQSSRIEKTELPEAPLVDMTQIKANVLADAKKYIKEWLKEQHLETRGDEWITFFNDISLETESGETITCVDVEATVPIQDDDDPDFEVRMRLYAKDTQGSKYYRAFDPSGTEITTMPVKDIFWPESVPSNNEFYLDKIYKIPQPFGIM